MDDNSRVVLLVDDEAAIRRLVRSALAGLDCEVVEAGDGPEAIGLFKQYEKRIALLVTDVVMPGMHGDDLAILLTGLRPELPVLFVSAYYSQIQQSVQHLQCFAKPFHPAALARRVAEILDSGGKPTLSSGTQARSANEEARRALEDHRKAHRPWFFVQLTCGQDVNSLTTKVETKLQTTVPPSRNSAMNMIVVFEDQATKQCQESKPYAFASALEVRCLCGNLIHPIPGAWCPQCGTKVVEVRPESRTEWPSIH